MSGEAIDPELAAARLLAAYRLHTGIVDVVPVPVERIAEHYLGYRIDITDEGLFADPGYLGGILFDEQVIRVNASVEEHEGRYCFTIAHEIGHHVLHRASYLAESVANGGGYALAEPNVVEAQADRFAAALLMPADAVRLVVAQDDFRPRTPRQLRAYAGAIRRRGGFANVSIAAMANRLIDLGLVTGLPRQTGTPYDFARMARNRWIERLARWIWIRWRAVSARCRRLRAVRNRPPWK